MLKRFFKYIQPLWMGRDGKISLRSLLAMVLATDFVINVHNSSYVVIKVLNLILKDKTVDAALISSLSGYAGQTAFILATEAALIAALLALKTYQNNSELRIPSNPTQPAGVADTSPT